MHTTLRLARITDYHIRYCFIVNVSAGMLTTEHRALRVKIYQIQSGDRNSEYDVPLHASCNIPSL